MTAIAQTSLAKLLEFLDRLDSAKVPYHLTHVRDSIMVEIAVPGERWEVEFFADCHVEFERFTGSGVVEDANKLEALLSEYINS